MTIQKGIVTVLATGALFVSTLSPLALADTSISGNGAVSDNTVTQNNNSSTTVTQNNNANIRNNVDSSTNTGGNHADFNTGGSSAINTGDASNNTWISTQANANVASLQGASGNNGGSGQVAIVGNGAFSDNTAHVNNNNKTTLSQNNTANITNTVKNTANTGDNSGSFNTGGGTTILTGNAGSNTSISTSANANIARVDGFGGGSGASALIAGNGAESDNAITLNNRRSTTLDQNNNAYITNDVTNRADTGHNSGDFNTGGGVFIATGNAINNTNIQNRANFNLAELDACGCVTDGSGHIAIVGNGAFSQNNVRDNFSNTLANYQNNYADIANNVKNNQNTGYNSSDYNTSDHFWNGGSPSFLFTGSAQNNTGVSTEANKNIVGTDGGYNLGGTGIGLSFNMNDLLNQLHI